MALPPPSSRLAGRRDALTRAARAVCRRDAQLYFPNVYDIKYLMKFCGNLHGGLSKLAETLRVERIGPQHQAGSDSLLTSFTFLKLTESLFQVAPLRGRTSTLSVGDRHAGCRSAAAPAAGVAALTGGAQPGFAARKGGVVPTCWDPQGWGRVCEGRPLNSVPPCCPTVWLSALRVHLCICCMVVLL